jgi:hypothetical protein
MRRPFGTAQDVKVPAATLANILRSIYPGGMVEDSADRLGHTNIQHSFVL